MMLAVRPFRPAELPAWPCVVWVWVLMLLAAERSVVFS